MEGSSVIKYMCVYIYIYIYIYIFIRKGYIYIDVEFRRN